MTAKKNYYFYYKTKKIILKIIHRENDLDVNLKTIIIKTKISR